MTSSPVERLVALGLLAGVLAGFGAVGWSWVDSYADGQREIADKQIQLRNLLDLAEARTGFARLVRRGAAGTLILTAEANPQEALASAVNHAADSRQVLLDGVDALPSGPTLVAASVHLRGTQSGLYGFLQAIEDATPYLAVIRLEVDVFRPADADRGKPLILRADVRIAAAVAPAVTPRQPAAAPP